MFTCFIMFMESPPFVIGRLLSKLYIFHLINFQISYEKLLCWSTRSLYNNRLCSVHRPSCVVPWCLYPYLASSFVDFIFLIHHFHSWSFEFDTELSRPTYRRNRMWICHIIHVKNVWLLDEQPSSAFSCMHSPYTHHWSCTSLNLAALSANAIC